MEPCETPYIDCDNDELAPEQLFRLLLAKLANDQPALRTCVANGDEVGGVRVDHFVATAGQTVFPLSGPIRQSYAWHRNGAIQHNTPAFTVGDTSVTLPAQPLGTEITIIS